MAKRKKAEFPYSDWTYDELAGKIDSEGFDYFFCSWASEEEFNDPELKKLVVEYNRAQKALEGFLRARGGML